MRANYGVTIGRSLVLATPGLPNYIGWVAWSYLGESGLEAAQELSEPAVEHIIVLDSQANSPDLFSENGDRE